MTFFAYKNKINAEKWNLNGIQIMCSDGRVEGVEKFGKFWAIPINAEKPIDHRITSGQYKNWRDKIINSDSKKEHIMHDD